MESGSMKRILLALALFAAPLGAQPTQAQYDSLKARVEFLERFVGTQYVGKSSGELAAALVPESTLPGGRYPIFLSDYQIRVGLAGMESAFQAQLSGFAQRVAAVEGNGQYNPQRVIYADTIILGSCAKSDVAAQLRICGISDASIYNESNGDGTQHQNPSRHFGMWSMAADGGMRMLQNQYVSTNCVPATDTNANPPVQYMDCLKTFVDPNREVGMFGPDSRAQFSWYVASAQRNPDGSLRYPHERTQDLVLRTYEGSKTLTLESWRPGWKIEFATSSGLISIDKWFSLPPKQ
jgi:hypothetical protein